MRKTLLIIEIILFAAAAVMLLLCAFYWTLRYQTNDASKQFYERTYNMFLLFLRCGIITLVAGVITVIIRHFRGG